VTSSPTACGAILSIKHFAGMQPPSKQFLLNLHARSPVGALKLTRSACLRAF